MNPLLNGIMARKKSLKKKVKIIYSKYSRSGLDEDLRRKASSIHRRYSGMRIILDKETSEAIEHLKHLAEDESSKLSENVVKQHINNLS